MSAAAVIQAFKTLVFHVSVPKVDCSYSYASMRRGKYDKDAVPICSRKTLKTKLYVKPLTVALEGTPPPPPDND